MIDILVLVYAVLTLLDIATTSYGVRKLDATEINPIMMGLMKVFGRDVALALKLVLVAVVYHYRVEIGELRLQILDGLMLATVLWNAYQIRKATK